MVLVVFATIAGLHLAQTAKKQITSTGKIKVEEILHRQINLTCQSVIHANEKDYIETREKDNAVVQIGVDARKINDLTARCNVECENDLRNYERLTMDIPRGSLLGSTYLADKGHAKTFNLRVSYELHTNYSTLTQAVGINQVRYAVYLVVEATAHVTVPSSVGDATYTYYLPVCETIYSGEVPNVYVADENGTNYLDLLP